MKNGAFLKMVEKGLDRDKMNIKFSMEILLLYLAEDVSVELQEYLEPFGLASGNYEKIFDDIHNKIENLAKKIAPKGMDIDKKMFLADDFERFKSIIDAFMNGDKITIEQKPKP